MRADLAALFAPYALPAATLEDVTAHLASSPQLLAFLLCFHHTLAEPAASRALTSALTIAGAYFVGGLLPLLPYFFVATVSEGLWVSSVVMAGALFAFGYAKTGVVVGWRGRVREGVVGGGEMVVVGGAAAGAAMGLVRLFSEVGGL